MPFVSIEGIDGSGKTTQTEFLDATLRSRGLNVLRTKEPDGGWIGAEVRSILVKDRDAPLSPQEEMLLVFAARYNHVHQVIRPILEAGGWVVTDRFADSTFAFQVFETGVSEAAFDAIRTEVLGETIPDFTFILDIDPATAVNRRGIRGGKKDVDPAEATRNFERIRNGLLEVARREPVRCHVIDATAPPQRVADMIIAKIDAPQVVSSER
jgi:dTMP kinase